ncbi:HET-domain-containing protein [Xylariaceae sp. FL1272]|nr:HET-domain-containing protein [Xylariaceae sp. FL1272]
MRFIDTTTLEFREIFDLNGSNKYAILSHRWTYGSDEISYADVLSMDSKVKAKPSYAKLTGACPLARELGYELLWIDTCCINRTDSVELGEAINSMYRWYSKSSVCIVYLQDVNEKSDIESSEWFTRGWTLQELIAPSDVCFYGSDFQYLGDKASLSDVLMRRTLIPVDVLHNRQRPQAYSIAQRMSWAARRTTTRIEDRAYSLMGLFDVNMPMIYGERERAFIRLQEHIMSKSADESIFSWDFDPPDYYTKNTDDLCFGLLATSPSCFAECGGDVYLGKSRGFHISQLGLSISLPATVQSLGVFQASLNVGRASEPGQYTITLIKLPGTDQYGRVRDQPETRFIAQQSVGHDVVEFTVILEPTETPPALYHGFWLRKLDFQGSLIGNHEVVQRRRTKEDDRIMLPDNRVGTAGIIRLELAGTYTTFGWIKLGFDAGGRPICQIRLCGMGDQLDRIMMEDYKDVKPISKGASLRIDHPFFDDAWLLPDQVPPIHSHTFIGDVFEGFNSKVKLRDLELRAAATLVQDTRRGMKEQRKMEVWAIDMSAEKVRLPTSAKPNKPQRPKDTEKSDCCVS